MSVCENSLPLWAPSLVAPLPKILEERALRAGLQLRQTCAGFLPANHAQPPPRPCVQPRSRAVKLRCGANRDYYVEFNLNMRAVKSWLAYADDFELMTIERNHAADGARHSGKMFLPESIAQDRRACAPSPVVGFRQQASCHGSNAKRPEVIPAYKHSIRPAHCAALGQVEGRRFPRENARKNVLVVPQLFPKGIRGHTGRLDAGVARVFSTHLDQLFRPLHRQHAYHHAINQAEDRGIGA